MNNIFFIENDHNDFKYFSNILKCNGYNVYPQDIANQDGLSNFLHNRTCDYKQLKNNIFDYIIEKELYDDKLDFLILDINLLDKDSQNNLDESGKKLLRDFRTDFYSYFKQKIRGIEKYKNWSSSIWTIALTNFGRNKCKQLENEYGTFLSALNKADIIADNQYLITKLRNMENQKNSDKEYQQTVSQAHNGDIIYGDKITGDKIGRNQYKTTAPYSPIINIAESEITLAKELKSHNVTPEDINELVKILTKERQAPSNETLISKMKNWWNKVKSYVRDLSIEVLGGLLSSLCLLPLEQVLLVIQAIQQ